MQIPAIFNHIVFNHTILNDHKLLSKLMYG